MDTWNISPLIGSWTHVLTTLTNRRSNSIGLLKRGNSKTKESGSQSVKSNNSFPILWGKLKKMEKQSRVVISYLLKQYKNRRNNIFMTHKGILVQVLI